MDSYQSALLGKAFSSYWCFFSQGGLHIYETAENVEGLEDKNSLSEIPWLTEYNFNYVEKNNERLSKQPDGTILKETVPRMKSKYKIQYSKDTKSNNKFSFFRYQVIRKSDNKIMASYNYIEKERDMFFWDKHITKVLKPRKEEK